MKPWSRIYCSKIEARPSAFWPSWFGQRCAVKWPSDVLCLGGIELQGHIAHDCNSSGHFSRYNLFPEVTLFITREAPEKDQIRISSQPEDIRFLSFRHFIIDFRDWTLVFKRLDETVNFFIKELIFIWAFANCFFNFLIDSDITYACSLVIVFFIFFSEADSCSLGSAIVMQFLEHKYFLYLLMPFSFFLSKNNNKNKLICKRAVFESL